MQRFLSRAFASAALVAASAFAQDFSKVEIRTTKLAEDLYVLQGAGGNLALSVGPDAVFLVDDQYAPLSPRIMAAIAAITPQPVRFVLNTHWHGDHVGGNENFGKAGALIVAHDNVRKRMSTEQFTELFKRSTPPSSPASLPVVTFAGAVTFHLNGDEIRAIHVPNAHTDGDAIVHFLKRDVIHMGDVYWNSQYPFIDTSSGGSVDGTIAAVDRVLEIAGEKTRIIAGHGTPVAGKAELKAYRDMLATVAARVKRLLAEGRTPEQVKAANVSAEFDAKWGGGFIKPDRFAEMLAADIAKAARR